MPKKKKHNIGAIECFCSFFLINDTGNDREMVKKFKMHILIDHMDDCMGEIKSIKKRVVN